MTWACIPLGHIEIYESLSQSQRVNYTKLLCLKFMEVNEETEMEEKE